MLRNLSQRARAAVFVSAVALAAVPVIGTVAEGNSAVKNPDCTDLGYAADVKIDPPVPGSYTVDGVTYTFSIVDSPEGEVMSWTSTAPVLGVISKGGSAGYIHTPYAGGATSGSGLHTPLNPSGSWADFSHINFCVDGGGGETTTTTAAPTTTTTVLPPLEPLTLDVDAAGSYTKTWLWSIAKAADVEWIARSGGSAPIGYTVTTTRTGYELSEQALTGTVTVTNPNTTTVDLTSLTVSGADCQVQEPTQVAAGDTELDVVCDITGVTTVGALPTSLDAAVEWADPSPLAEVFGAAATGAIAYDVTEVNPTVSVVDAYDGGAAEPITTGTYARTAATPATEGCRTVGNTATIVETGQSASDSVTVCRQALTKGGFTIGFWQNKNGQNVITANAASLCSKLAAYGTAWAGTGFPTTCNATTLKAWVTAVIKNATSKDHTLMLRAQMLATALNVHTDTVNHLGDTDVSVNGACQTVGELLQSTNATWSSLAANRTAALAIKDIFDRINNNVQQVCP